MHPGHFWFCKFGTVPGSMNCVEKKFELQSRKWEEYKDTRYYEGDRTLIVELWLHRVVDDLSGLTFQEWDPSGGTDDVSSPVAMLVNSSELRAANFHLKEVSPLRLAWKTTMTSGHDVSEYLGTLGLVKSYFFKFFEKQIKKIEKKIILVLHAPQRIRRFACLQD